MSYFVEIPNYRDCQPAKIHEVEVLQKFPHKDELLTRWDIMLDYETQQVHPSRVYETLEAAEASKAAYDKQEIERCQRFLAALERSENDRVC